jgi:hypothetical protein
VTGSTPETGRITFASVVARVDSALREIEAQESDGDARKRDSGAQESDHGDAGKRGRGRPAAPEPDTEQEVRSYAHLTVRLGPDGRRQELEERFEVLCDRLRLDALDRAVLAVCVAPEIDVQLARSFESLYGDPAHSLATPRLVARLLAVPGVSDADVLVCFDRQAPLILTGAVRIQGAGPLADRSAVVAPQIASHLLGANLYDYTRGGRLRRLNPTTLPLGRQQIVERLTVLRSRPSELPLLVTGPDAPLLLAAAVGHGLVMLDANAAAADDEACADLALASALEDRIAVVDGLEELPVEGRDVAVERLCTLPARPVFCASGPREALALADRPLVEVEIPEATLAEREAAWRAATGEDKVGEVAERFRLEIARIGEAAAAARAEAAMAGGDRLDAELMMRGARLASSRRVGELAELIPPGPTWEDLVLPARQLASLHLLSSFLAHREQVLGDWRFAPVAGERGLTALFAGESGTGKTMASRVIGAAVGLDVYRIDLAGLFSKWVGETEKNLDRIFRAAHGANAVLLFDEADVVFGKRTEASDSGDRYANLETAYLLQRIERYNGVVVLATNLLRNMDEAFVRRLDVVVDFPPPQAETRRRLWRALLPTAAPVGDDVDLDFLAERFELTGGGVRNCTLAAAFLAAEDETPIQMAHLIRAVALEYAKLGRLTVEADFDRFHALVADAGKAAVRLTSS